MENRWFSEVGTWMLTQQALSNPRAAVFRASMVLNTALERIIEGTHGYAITRQQLIEDLSEELLTPEELDEMLADE